jgi:hypothetical protein
MHLHSPRLEQSCEACKPVSLTTNHCDTSAAEALLPPYALNVNFTAVRRKNVQYVTKVHHVIVKYCKNRLAGRAASKISLRIQMLQVQHHLFLSVNFQMLKKIFAILALASSGTALQAATLTYTAVVAPSATAYFNFTEPSSPAWWSGGPRVFTATNWSQNLALQKFDPALGTLNSVSITYRGSIYSRAKVESLDEEAVTVTESWSGTMGFTFPGGARQTSGLSYSLSQNFSAYDGTTDFGGTSGASLSPFFIETNSGNPITQTESTNLGSYIGTDTFSVPVDASGRATFAGAGLCCTSRKKSI